MFDPEEKKIRFKLLAGNHIAGGKKYSQGDTFEEFPFKVEWMSHRLERIDPLPPPVSRRSFVALKKEHRGGGKWNVLNENGNLINDKLLTEDEADELILVGIDEDETDNG